jgi:hypothetical protein
MNTIVYVYGSYMDYVKQAKKKADAFVSTQSIDVQTIERALASSHSVLSLARLGFSLPMFFSEKEAVVYHNWGSHFEKEDEEERFAVFKYPDSHTGELKVRFVQVTDKDSRYIKGMEDGQFKNFLRSKIVKVEVIPV